MTFEEMNFKQKVEHIWEYYKLHMFAGLMMVLLIGSLLNIYVINPPPSVVVDVTFRMEWANYNADFQDALKQGLIDAVIDFPDSETVTVELLQTDTGMDPNTLMATQAKFMGKAEVGELDILVMGEETFKSMLLDGALLNLTELEESTGMILPEEMKVLSVDPATSKEGHFALDAARVPGLLEMFLESPENHYIGVFVTASPHDKVMSTLQYLIQ